MLTPFCGRAVSYATGIPCIVCEWMSWDEWALSEMNRSDRKNRRRRNWALVFVTMGDTYLSDFTPGPCIWIILILKSVFLLWSTIGEFDKQWILSTRQLSTVENLNNLFAFLSWFHTSKTHTFIYIWNIVRSVFIWKFRRAMISNINRALLFDLCWFILKVKRNNNINNEKRKEFKFSKYHMNQIKWKIKTFNGNYFCNCVCVNKKCHWFNKRNKNNIRNRLGKSKKIK